MASQVNSPNTRSRHEAPDREANKPPPTVLNVLGPPLTAAETIAQTAEYAKDPRNYLESRYGNTDLHDRRDLLCIPDKVDKDIYGTGEHKSHFEQHIANLAGKKHGLFFITGVQAQLAALKVHCERAGNNRVAWHVSSHLESAEESSYESLYGLQRRLFGSDSEKLPTIHEIKETLDLPSDQRPAAILIEVPNRELGCQTYTFAELGSISSACKEAGVVLHCDGARLWEIEPYYQSTAGKILGDIGRLFDTVYVSFYKGLRGAAGAMLLSDDEPLIKDAKMWQRRAGGNVFSLFYDIIDCERGFNENVGTFSKKWAKVADIAEGINSATESFKKSDGSQIVSFIPDPPTCCQLRTIFQGFTVDELLSARDKVQEKQNVRIFNQPWPKKSLDQRLKDDRDGEKEVAGDDRRHFIEWMVGNERLGLPTKVYVDAYVALCEELVAAGRG